MDNNVVELPTAKNYLYNNPKSFGPEVIDLVLDSIKTMNKEQIRLLDKRIKLADEIIKALPENKRKLFEKYTDLQLQDTILIIEKAIKWTINHEAEINEVMTG
jgi:prophage DNA circulation protein